MWAYSYSRVSFFSLSVLLLCIGPARSEEPPCTTRKLPVSFRDAHNLPLQSISVTDLEAQVHGKAIKILSIAPDPRPHRLILVLDTSGSITGSQGDPALWNLELSLARHFFAVNRQRSQVALLLFNNQVTDIIDFSPGNSTVADKLQQIGTREYAKAHIRGRTALRDAIFRGIQLLDHPSSADAIYVLTDGGDNASHQSASELDGRLAVTSVRLFAVLLVREFGYRNRTPEEENGPRDLAETAQKSGGEILTAAAWVGSRVALSANAEAKAKSEEILNRLYQTILQDNLLEVELPFPIAKNEKWELKLSSAARRQWKNAKITYPNTLISCNAEVSGSGRN